MWRNTYKDYKPDEEWVKERVEPQKGIIGCEMHEINGWGESLHQSKQKKNGCWRSFLNLLFKKE